MFNLCKTVDRIYAKDISNIEIYNVSNFLSVMFDKGVVFYNK